MTKPRIRVLIVDDDTVDRMACRRALAHNPDCEFVLSEAGTGAEGLRLVRAEPPDCILLDYQLPDMNGLDFLSALADKNGNVAVPVLKLTGADSAAIAVEAMKRGARDYLVKDAQRQYLDLVPVIILRVLREQRLLTEKREAEAKYRSLVEQMPAIIYVSTLDENARLLYISPQIRTLGFSPEEWLADPDAHFKRIHAEDRLRVTEEFARSRHGTTPLRCEYRLLARNGQALWFRDEASVVRDNSGTPLFLQGLLVDISAAKRAEDELREHRFHLEELVTKRTAALTRANEQLRRELGERERVEQALQQHADDLDDLYNNAPCGYHSLDHDGRFIQINDTELSWLGYSREEILGGMAFGDLLTADGLETFRTKFPLFRERGWARDIEFDLLRRDGSLMPVVLHATAQRDANGNFVKSRTTLFDVTEHKRTEELRQSRELLRQLSAHHEAVREEERKRIAREIHDELGQKLTALQLEVAMLNTRLGDLHPALGDKTRSILELIDATMESVRTIATDLRPAVLDLGLVPAIEWQVQEFAQRSGIACELAIGDDEIILDDNRATAVFRILQESLTNIARHAHASRVDIALHAADGTLVMEVADNGIGIAQGETRKAASFGLVGIRERVHMLGGELRIEGGPRRGTALAISIPTAVEAAAS
jgi:PAS domain S-box-containing protein